MINNYFILGMYSMIFLLLGFALFILIAKLDFDECPHEKRYRYYDNYTERYSCRKCGRVLTPDNEAIVQQTEMGDNRKHTESGKRLGSAKPDVRKAKGALKQAIIRSDKKKYDLQSSDEYDALVKMLYEKTNIPEVIKGRARKIIGQASKIVVNNPPPTSPQSSPRSNLVKRLTKKYLVIASTYAAVKLEKGYHIDLEELTKTFDGDVKRARRSYHLLVSELKLKIPVDDDLPKLAEQKLTLLNLPSWLISEIKITVENRKMTGYFSSRVAAGICIVLKKYNMPYTLTQIIEKLGMNGNTLRRYRTAMDPARKVPSDKQKEPRQHKEIPSRRKKGF